MQRKDVPIRDYSRVVQILQYLFHKKLRFFRDFHALFSVNLPDGAQRQNVLAERPFAVVCLKKRRREP